LSVELRIAEIIAKKIDYGKYGRHGQGFGVFINAKCRSFPGSESVMYFISV